MRLAGDLLRELVGERDGDATHMHVVGSSGNGKSKFVEYLFREAVLRSAGIVVIDWSGSLYRDLAGYLAALRPYRDIFILNPSDVEYVTPYNPFTHGNGDDIGTTVNRFIKLAVTPWDQKDTTATPTVEKVSRVLFHYQIAAGETLPNAALLIDEMHGRDVSRHAETVLDTPDHHNSLRKLRELLSENQSARQWQQTFQSSDSRINRYLDPRSFERLIGFKDESLNIADILDRNAILLVNLSQSGNLDADMARSIASFLLNDLLVAAQRRRGTDQHSILFLDEFQEYMSVDMATMLDQVRGGGLHLVLSHQHLGHLVDDAHLRKSVMTNARIKVCFGGLDFEDAAFMAHELYLREMNQRQVVRQIVGQRIADQNIVRVGTTSLSNGRQTSRSRGQATAESGDHSTGGGKIEHEDEHLGGSSSHQEGDREGWSSMESTSESDAESETKTTGEAVLVRTSYEDHIVGEIERSRDDRIGEFAARLKLQPQRRCVIKVKAHAAAKCVIPWLDSYGDDAESLRGFELDVYAAQGVQSASSPCGSWSVKPAPFRMRPAMMRFRSVDLSEPVAPKMAVRFVSSIPNGVSPFYPAYAGA
jgi:hypothetical protein